MNMVLSDDAKNNINKQNVDSNIDFWKDARKFLDTQLPEDFQENLYNLFSNLV